MKLFAETTNSNNVSYVLLEEELPYADSIGVQSIACVVKTQQGERFIWPRSKLDASYFCTAELPEVGALLKNKETGFVGRVVKVGFSKETETPAVEINTTIDCCNGEQDCFDALDLYKSFDDFELALGQVWVYENRGYVITSVDDGMLRLSNEQLGIKHIEIEKLLDSYFLLV